MARNVLNETTGYTDIRFELQPILSGTGGHFMQPLFSGKALLPIAITVMLSAWSADSFSPSIAAAPGAIAPGSRSATAPSSNPSAPSLGVVPGATGTLMLTVNGAIGNGNMIAQNGLGVRTQLKEGANTLNAGVYAIIVNGIRRPAAIVDSLLLGAVSPPRVAITAGGMASCIATYAGIGGGRLWLPVSSNKTLQGYGAAGGCKHQCAWWCHHHRRWHGPVQHDL